MWYSREDRSAPVFTAAQHAESRHGDGERRRLPALCILFYMGGVIAPLVEQGAVCVMEKLPRFLGGTPVYQLPDAPVCFLDGGRGAPQARTRSKRFMRWACGRFSLQACAGRFRTGRGGGQDPAGQGVYRGGDEPALCGAPPVFHTVRRIS